MIRDTTGESPAYGLDFGIALCEALGFDGGNVHELTLRVNHLDVVTVTVERYVSLDEGRSLTTLFETYELHKRAEVSD